MTRIRKFLFPIIALLTVFATAFSCVCCAGRYEPVRKTEEKNEITQSVENLEITRADFDITAEQKLSRIKSEYLKENNGYKADDEVIAILSLDGDALIDSYLDGSSSGSVADYAATRQGKAQASSIAAAQSELITNLYNRKLITGVEHKYSTVINAVAVKTVYSNFLKLKNVRGVDGTYLSDTFNRPKTAERAVENLVTNAVDVYPTGIFDSSSVNYTGKRTAVAILDSGFDCSHSVFDHDLKDDELWITREDVEKALPETRAAEFTPDLKLSDVWYSKKIPFSYDYADKDNDVFPYDSEHGTHVAGIIGGKDDVITGVAVDTQLVLLKVFPDLDDGADTDDILAALDDAVLLNVDAINMSLGSSCGFAREADGDPINAVYDKINKSGISLITAASNSYSSGYGGAQGNTNLVTNPDSGTVGSPSTYAAALSVASISGTMSRYIVGNDSQIVFFLESNSVTGDPNDFFKELYEDLGKKQGETLELEYMTVPGVGRRTNYTAIADQIKGKVALVRRGDNTFEDKALQAKNAGAIACIIYNNVDGDINMSMGKTDHIPTISISKDDGTALAAHSSGTLTIKYSNEAGPFMSDFSSWGPSPNLELKPEITAHGGNIKSSVPGGGYDELSGTSMATPNLCGITVLIRQYLKDEYPDLSTKQISVLANQLMMSTATIALDEQGNPYSPRKQGAGLASLKNVVNTRAYLTVDGKDRSKIELYDDPERKGEYTLDFNVVNLSDEPVDYEFSLVGMTESVSTSDASHVAEQGRILDGAYTVESSGDGSVSGSAVSVDANGTLKLSVKYSLSDADKKLIDSLFPYGMYVEGFVKLEATADDVDLNIPFLAFYGDWTQAPMFDKTFYEVETEAHNGAIDDEDKIKADYFATTPYGSYFYNYIIPLGSYLYDIDENKYDPIPATEDHIAVSNQIASIDGISAVYGGLLRGAKEMNYSIVDKASGEVVWEFTDDNAHKAYSIGGTPMPYYEYLNLKAAENEFTGTGVRKCIYLGLENNKQYEFKMQGLLDYGEDGGLNSNARNTFSFDFVCDTEAPVVKSAEYEKTYDRTLKKDRYYVTLTVYDNHYVQAISPVTFTSNSSYAYRTADPVPVYGDKGSDCRVRIEITDYLEDLDSDYICNNAIGFYIDDYALNGNIFLCQLPGTRGDFKFTSDGTPEGVEVQVQTIDVDEVFDLTSILSTTDKSVDGGKDYLKHLSWTSANEEVAIVKDGQVRGVAPGKTAVTAVERIEGKRASILINVREPQTEQPKTTSAVKGRADSNNHVDDATDASLETLRFTYFDTMFAYSRAAQTSAIGETGDRFYITSLSGPLSFYPGESIKLAYEITPWYVYDKYKDFTFESSDPAVVKVEQDGTVTALKKGSATVTLSVAGSRLSAALRFTVNSEFVIENRMLVAYKGLGGHVEIPDDEGILYIGPYAFCLYDTDRTVEINEEDLDANKIPQANTAITSVKVPEGVEEIQKYAFHKCSALKTVELPSSIRFIREYAFYENESLETINLGDVEAIGARAFYNCTALETVDLSNMYAVATEGFYGSGLTTVDLTALRNTGARAFSRCAALESVKFDVNGNTKLAPAMFALSGLKSVDIYETVSIPESCFARCEKLETVNIRNSLVSIGKTAFSQNTALTEVVFHGSVDYLEEQAFYACEKLPTVQLPEGDVSLGDYLFLDCKALESIGFEDSTNLVSVGGAFLSGTKVTTFYVNSSSKNYRYDPAAHILTDKAGETVVLAASGAAFGDYTLPASIKKIADGAFSGTDITKLTVTNKDLVIGNKAFTGCDKLNTVVLPTEKGVTIGEYAFAGSVLEKIENLEYAAAIGKYAFSRTDKLIEATVGEGMTLNEGAFYRSGIQKITLGANTEILMGAFAECEALRDVIMPAAGGVEIGVSAFSRCSVLDNIDLTKAQGTIGEQAFYGCIALATAKLDNVTAIDRYAFADCSRLNTVTIPKLERLGEGVFSHVSTDSNSGYNAPIFTGIDLPATLTEMGDGVFLGCSRLATVTFAGKITKLPDYTFALCTALSSVMLPESVNEIGVYAFRGCEELKVVNLDKVTTVGAHAFENAYSLGSVISVSLESAEYVDEFAFSGADVSHSAVGAPKLKYIGKAAFKYSTFTMFDAPALEYIGEEAFLFGKLTEFTFGDKLSYVGRLAFLCPDLKSFYAAADGGKSDTAVINDYAFVDGGALYTTVYPSGRTQLSAIPAALDLKEQSGVFTVKEGTARIEVYAANANKNIRSVVFPDSLRSIGDYAFYGCDSLRDAEFRSSVAPTLENLYQYNAEIYNYYISKGYSEDQANTYARQNSLWVDWYSDMYELSTDAPGYELLHNQFDIFGYSLYYYTFKGLAGSKPAIQMTLPKNETLYGYDGIIYEAFFGKAADAQRTDYIAREKSMVEFVDYATEIKAIETITSAHEALVAKAVIAYNAITQDPAAYGYDQAEWDALVSAVMDARETINEIKVKNAPLAVRNVQAMIDALPDSYSADVKDQLDALTAKLTTLRTDERALLDLTKYNKLMTEYENTQSGETPASGDGDGKKIDGARITAIVCIAAAACAAVIVIVLLVTLKKKKHNETDPKGDEAKADTEEAKPDADEKAETAEVKTDADEKAETEEAKADAETVAVKENVDEKPATAKASGAKKTSAAKSTVAKSTAVKSGAAKTAGAKKSTTAAKTTTATKSTGAKKPSASKSTAAKKPAAKNTAAKPTGTSEEEKQ